jgi:magnesium transporter
VARFVDRHPAEDVAPLFSQLTRAENRLLFDALLESKRLGKTLEAMPDELLRDVLGQVDDDRLAVMLGRRPADETAWFLQRLPEDRRTHLLQRLDGEFAGRVTRLLRYAPGTAGAMMLPRFLAMGPERTVRQAVEAIQGREEALPEASDLHVIDAGGRLLGVVPLAKLILASPAARLDEVMSDDAVTVSVDDDQEKVAALVARFDLLSIPVADRDGKLAGVVTVADVIDVIHEEATEDFHRMAGLSGEERVFSPVVRSAGRRFSWMVLNLGTAFVASSTISLFEGTLAKLVALAAFMPIIAGLGGNCGTQALSVMIRGLTVGELAYSSRLGAVARQVGVGMLLGAAAGLIAGCVVWLWQGNPWLGVVIFLAMVANMTLGALAGAVVPLLLQASGRDPALGSGILVTALTDSLGFLLFLGLATLMMTRIVA